MAPAAAQKKNAKPVKQAIDANGAPVFKVDPFWPKRLPNRWSMQQIVGISVDTKDHIWYLNRGTGALPIELTAEGNPSPALCCVRGPELIETDQQGNVVSAWGGPGYIPQWPRSLQTVIVDSKGFVWVSGEANEDSILKFSHDGKTLVWDFDHRPTAEQAKLPENNQETKYLLNKGRFQLDEVANEIYIINQKRVLVYDASTGAYKRGWGGHGMPLSEVTNKDISGYKWTGGPPPDEKNFVPNLHFVEISKDRKVYIGERGQDLLAVRGQRVVLVVVLQVDRELVDPEVFQLTHPLDVHVDRANDAEAVDDLVGHEGGVAVTSLAVLVVVVPLTALDVVGERLRYGRLGMTKCEASGVAGDLQGDFGAGVHDHC